MVCQLAGLYVLDDRSVLFLMLSMSPRLISLVRFGHVFSKNSLFLTGLRILGKISTYSALNKLKVLLHICYLFFTPYTEVMQLSCFVLSLFRRQ